MLFDVEGSAMSVWMFLVGIWALAVTSSSEQGGLLIRSTPTAFSYADRLAEKLIAIEANTAKIPDVKAPIKGGPGSGEFQLTSIQVTRFLPPKLTHELKSPNDVHWDIKADDLVVNADWKASYRILLKIKTSGHVQVVAKGIRLAIDAQLLKGDNNMPRVSITSCSAYITSLTTEISGGGVIPWIINLFKHDISAKIKDSLVKMVCASGTRVLQNFVNAEVQMVPTKIPVFSKFMLDYGLAGQPAVVDSNLDVPINATVTWMAESTPIQAPALPAFDLPSGRPQMLYLLGSDYILNTLMFSAHKHDVLRFIVNSNTSDTLASFLQTDCGWSICISDFIPGLYKTYRGKELDLVIHSRYAPNVEVEQGTARLNASFYIDAYISPWYETKILAFRAEQDLQGYMNVSVNGSMIVGNIKFTQSKMRMTNSTVGAIPDSEIKLFEGFAIPILETAVNSHLNQGIAIPSVPGVKFINPIVTMKTRAIQIGVDINYLPPAAPNYL